MVQPDMKISIRRFRDRYLGWKDSGMFSSYSCFGDNKQKNVVNDHESVNGVPNILDDAESDWYSSMMSDLPLYNDDHAPREYGC